jgi:histone deacetylase 1/2
MQAIVRLDLTIAISCSLKINELDIHNVFLNGTLHEEVYMHQPLCFVYPTISSRICRPHKSLYGLKQVPRTWYTHLSDYLLSIGFYASKVDTSLFILYVDTDIFYPLVHVDDILLTRSNSIFLHRLI